jgi:hypothetical protein
MGGLARAPRRSANQSISWLGAFRSGYEKTYGDGRPFL